ncbi:Putative F-box domain-containing protein [Septoria linicola]|uniref:F-box domain-containing protein n=1 Tax=Septoria linicola TaxID=215465 RepID=A0A9Q9AV69_9PEZI|nr:Putative F-box domain-containing protein [Septoria linicola]
MSVYSDSDDGAGDSDNGSDTSGSESDTSSTYSTTRGSAACTKTFNTAELLESILLFLPLRDLLKAQQVCKSWSMSIRASIKAQRALFSEPQSDETSLFFKWDAMSDNPRPAWPYFHKGDWISAIDAEPLQPTLNPLLTRNFFFKPRAGIYPATFITLHHNGIISPHWSEQTGEGVIGPSSKHHLCAIHRPEASWREMFVMQPPCEELNFVCHMKDSAIRYPPERVVVQRAEGVRMGDVVEQLREHWFECPFHATEYSGSDRARWDYEGFLFTQLKVFEETEVNELRACDIARHLETSA